MSVQTNTGRKSWLRSFSAPSWPCATTCCATKTSLTGSSQTLIFKSSLKSNSPLMRRKRRGPMRSPSVFISRKSSTKTWLHNLEPRRPRSLRDFCSWLGKTKMYTQYSARSSLNSKCSIRIRHWWTRSSTTSSTRWSIKTHRISWVTLSTGRHCRPFKWANRFWETGRRTSELH